MNRSGSSWECVGQHLGESRGSGSQPWRPHGPREVRAARARPRTGQGRRPAAPRRVSEPRSEPGCSGRGLLLPSHPQLPETTPPCRVGARGVARGDPGRRACGLAAGEAPGQPAHRRGAGQRAGQMLGGDLAVGEVVRGGRGGGEWRPGLVQRRPPVGGGGAAVGVEWGCGRAAGLGQRGPLSPMQEGARQQGRPWAGPELPFQPETPES